MNCRYVKYTFRLEKHGISFPDLYQLEARKYMKNAPIEKYLRRVYVFHCSPCVKYAYHLVCFVNTLHLQLLKICFQLSYIIFLLFFSFVLLFRFERPTNRIPSIDWAESFLIFFVWCMFVEEIYYAIISGELEINVYRSFSFSFLVQMLLLFKENFLIIFQTFSK